MSAKLKQREFLSLDCMFTVEIINVNHADTVKTFAAGLSAGGVCLFTDKPLPGETDLCLRFHFPNRRKTYNIEGRTIWTKQLTGQKITGYENGIEFFLINQELKGALANGNFINLHLQL